MSATISRSSAIGKPSSSTNAAESQRGTAPAIARSLHGAVHGEVADRAAGETQRLHDERVGGHRQPLTAGQR